MSDRRQEFEASALPYLDDLYRAAASMTGSRTEAEDLVQETFLEAWKSFHRFQPGTNCRAWMFKILIHRIHHYRRKWYQMFSKMQNDTLMLEQLEAVEDLHEAVRDEEILAALGRLPEMFREIVLLADVQEFSYKEIADMLGVPMGTVMSRLNRGRKHLRSELQAAKASEKAGLLSVQTDPH
jgi:RNA polymerase sigma-70 factor (ECF subfamily)